jgi:hypothetical protein
VDREERRGHLGVGHARKNWEAKAFFGIIVTLL